MRWRDRQPNAPEWESFLVSLLPETRASNMKTRESTADARLDKRGGTRRLPEFSALSLFSGAGGLDLGFESTNHFVVKACFDSDDDCLETLRTNQRLGREQQRHGFLREAKIVQADLASLGASDLTRTVGIARGDVDVIFGGPPCQPFSVIGKRQGLDDPRGNLILAFARIVAELMPRAFVFENVPGFETIDDGRAYAWLCKEFSSLGYTFWTGKLDASNYGDPTVRQRLFVVGALNAAPFGPPQASHADHDPSQLRLPILEALRPLVTVRDAISDLGSPALFDLPNRSTVAHKQSSILRFERLQFGERDEARRRNRL